MRDTGTKNTILITTIPPEAKGGIVALHRVLFENSSMQDYTVNLFPVGSSRPYQEGYVSRFYRIILRIIDFIFLLLKDRSIKIVHINTSLDFKAIVRDSLFIILSHLTRKKILLQIHSKIDAYEYPKTVDWIKKKVFSLCHKILVFSHEDREKTTLMFPMIPVEIFPNAINVLDFKIKDINYRKNLSVPENGRVVLFISRLFKGKGVFDLIHSIPDVVQNINHVYFVLAGDGPEKFRMEEECKRLDIEKVVRFPGNLPYEEVRRAFSCADIFVLPSYAEAMPMVVLQALAAGLPVIATPVGAIPDFIQDGVHGFIVPTHSPKQIAEKIVLLLQDDAIREKMEKINMQLAEREFDSRTVSKRLEQLYISL